MGKRATKVDKETRIMAIVRLISNGATTSDLVHHAAHEWGLRERQAKEYIKEARDVIVDDVNRERPQITAELIHVCQTVIKNGMKSGQLNNVVGAVNTIAKLGGLEHKQ
tara:strand:- start:477 stop:803 length:327 start_codon:yes stop_codon:yes gene_type:complete